MLERQMITDPIEADKFFMEDVWDDKDLLVVQEFTQELLDIYVNILSDYHSLPKKDIFHFAFEMTYHAISIFIDTCYRLKKVLKDYRLTLCNEKIFLDEFKHFFSSDTVDLSLGSSRILRCRLANLIALSGGYSAIFGNIGKDPQSITLDQTGVESTSKQELWLFKRYSWRVPEKLSNLFKVCLNRQCQKRKRSLTRIGYIWLNEEYLLQLSDIRFIPLNNIDFRNSLEQTPIEKRRAFYVALLPKVITKSGFLDGWQAFTDLKPSPTFLQVFLAFIVLRSEPLLCDPPKLKEAIQHCQKQIESKNVQALFSVGRWSSFPNTIVAAAGRRLGLPTILYQPSGHYGLPTLGKGFEKEELRAIDYYLTWGQYIRESDQPLTPRCIRVPSFHLYNLNNRGKKRQRKYKNRGSYFNILYSVPGLSNLFRMENWWGCNPDFLKQHRLRVQDIFSQLELIISSNNIRLFMKVKGWDYMLYKGYEYILCPQIELKNISVEYILKSSSDNYFDYVNMHFTSSAVSTTIMQSFAYNLPTVIFWDQRMYKLNPRYQSFFNQMVEAGIVATTSQQACNCIERIYNDPDLWFKKEVQEIKEEYLNMFGYFNKKWRNEIGTVLNTIVKNFRCNESNYQFQLEEVKLNAVRN